MNTLSFQLSLDEEEHIYIDGEPVPGSYWIEWGILAECLARSGSWTVKTCSCGIPECSGIRDYYTLRCGNLVAWRTFTPWRGANYVFERRQAAEAVYEAVKELDWLYFFHGDEHWCPCAPYNDGRFLQQHLATAKAVRDDAIRESRTPGTPTAQERLMRAICLGNLAAVRNALKGGADANHVADFRHWSEPPGITVLHTALAFAPEAVRLRIVQTLVEHGADVNQKAGFREYLLDDAIYNQDSELLEYLLPRLRTTADHRELLDAALRKGYAEYSCDAQVALHNAGIEGPDYEGEEPRWDRIAFHTWHAPLAGYPPPRFLQVAKEYLARFPKSLVS